LCHRVAPRDALARRIGACADRDRGDFSHTCANPDRAAQPVARPHEHTVAVKLTVSH
jgi:hypothetical protein